MFNKRDDQRNEFMLDGKFAKQGYDWWWHSLTAINAITGEEKQFFIEYFVINPALSKKVVLGKKGKNNPSYLMIKAGTWGKDKCQLHRFIDLGDVNIKAKAPFSITGPDFIINDTTLTGKIDLDKVTEDMMCDTGHMEWNLKAEKVIPYNVGYGAGKLFRKLKAFQMYWHVSGMKTLYEGEITFNGVKYIVTKDTSYGYADKNWGSDFTSPWVWLSSHYIVSNITGKKLENTVFDFGGGRPKVFFVALNRKLLGGLYYEGVEYEYNFSKFWMFPKTVFNCEESDEQILWHIRFENNKSVCLLEMTCEKKDMLLVKYESPDGMQRHNRLWNGGNGKGNIKLYKKVNKRLELIDDLEVSHMGCEYGEYC